MNLQQLITDLTDFESTTSYSEQQQFNTWLACSDYDKCFIALEAKLWANGKVLENKIGAKMSVHEEMVKEMNEWRAKQ